MVHLFCVPPTGPSYRVTLCIVYSGIYYNKRKNLQVVIQYFAMSLDSEICDSISFDNNRSSFPYHQSPITLDSGICEFIIISSTCTLNQEEPY